MPIAQQVHIVDGTESDHRHHPDTDTPAREQVAPVERESQYEQATPFDLSDFDGYRLPAFLEEVATEEGVEHDSHEDARLLHRADWMDDPEYGSDYGLLLVWPDETMMFVGSDPTASGPPWFAYTVSPFEPVPAPTDAQEALDRLKPPAVRDLVHEEGFVPARQGEWWLRPTEIEPVVHFRPGVSSRPFGPSPLDSHVPTQWGMSASEPQFMSRAREAVDLPASVNTVPEVIDWSVRQINKDDSELRWHHVREWAGDILVRGTLRHRNGDHPVEDIGVEWHIAEAHNIECYTADDIEGIHLDYYGA